jgi:uncharacterized protein involved in exopolysaccharide biosynthesis
MKQTPPRSTTIVSTNAANLLGQSLESTLLADQAKKSELLAKYDASFPLVVEINQEIAETEAAIKRANVTEYVNQETDRDPLFELVREDETKADEDRISATASLDNLERSVATTKDQLVTMDGLAVKSNALQREAKVAESSYLLYLSKRDQERTSDALDSKGIANVAIAVPATVPVLPRFSILMVLSIGFGFSSLCGFSTAYILEYVNPSFSTPDQVTKLLGVPVLASFPREREI